MVKHKGHSQSSSKFRPETKNKGFIPGDTVEME